MAARLEWEEHDLMLGSFNLAYVTSKPTGSWRMVILPVFGTLECEEERYQKPEDCMQDCESEVRRLLKEAGVTLGVVTETDVLQAAWAALDALPNYLKQATEAGTALHNIGVILAERGVKP